MCILCVGVCVFLIKIKVCLLIWLGMGSSASSFDVIQRVVLFNCCPCVWVFFTKILNLNQLVQINKLVVISRINSCL